MSESQARIVRVVCPSASSPMVSKPKTPLIICEDMIPGLVSPTIAKVSKLTELS